MTKALYRLGRACERHRFVVLGIWLILLIGVGGLVLSTGAKTNNDVTLPGTESQEAFDLLSEKFPPQQNGASPIVFHVTEGTLFEADREAAIKEGVAALKKLPQVNSVTGPYSQAGHLSGLMSADKQSAYLSVLLNTNSADVTIPEAQRVFDVAAAPARKVGIVTEAGGTIGSVLASDVKDDSAVIGIIAAMVILALVFGSLVAMGLPIVTAIFGLAIGLSVIGLLGNVANIPSVAPTLATMLGLGVGIDYALFMVTRHHDNVRAGVAVKESIARTTATSGASIVFAGGTVVVAITSLAIAQIPIVTALGYTSAIVVFVAIIGAITLLPALLAIVGTKIFAVKIPKFLRPKDSNPMDGIWAKWAHAVVNHPLIAAGIALSILIPLILPFFSLQFGQPDTALDPTTQTQRRAYDLIEQGWGPGYNGPFLLAVEITPPAAVSTEFADKDHLAHANKRQLEREKRSGDRLKHQLRNEKKRLKEKGKVLEKEAAPLQAKESQLEREAAALATKVAAAEAQGARLEAEKSRLEAQGAHLESKGKQLAAKAINLAERYVSLLEKEAVLLEKIANETDPVIRRQLVKQLRAVHAQAVATKNDLAQVIRQGEQLENQVKQLEKKGQALEREGKRLTTEGKRLARDAARLQAQGAELTVEAAPLQRRGDRLTAKGDRLQKEANKAERKAPRQTKHAKEKEKRTKLIARDLKAQMKSAGGDRKGTDPRLVTFQATLEAAAGVTDLSPPQLNDAGSTAVYSLIPDWGPSNPKTATFVNTLRIDVLPKAADGTGLGVYVGGSTASYVDLADLISEKLPLIIATVIALSFILLMLAFRSIAIPLSAGVMNLLSVGAAYGVLVMVFQWGWGLEFIGLGDAQTVPIASYVPLMMFAVLFGLSMDYEVFLMSRISEHTQLGENPHQAIVSGVANSARIITAAALIMVSVFASFILNPDPTIKQFGVGLSVAVAIDASIVRVLLVPASMALLGKWAWWMPKFLNRALPRINIEGEGAFEGDNAITDASVASQTESSATPPGKA